MTCTFTTDRAIRIMAGAFILISLALGVDGSPLFVSKNFLWFTAFVGANLFQSGFTRFCPAESIMVKLGLKRGDSGNGGTSCGR
ncbi:YgaP family membrane protein [Propionivibrio sp.]|uniref:YgaP family membrane protein n=1 Tax=Propionivibrio sp. TaxID=2212460 RepID=UPI003BF1E1E8